MVLCQKGEGNLLIREETEVKGHRMTLSCSQTRRSKRPGVKEIKEVEEMLAQGPAWDKCQWYPVVL